MRNSPVLPLADFLSPLIDLSAWSADTILQISGNQREEFLPCREFEDPCPVGLSTWHFHIHLFQIWRFILSLRVWKLGFNLFWKPPFSYLCLAFFVFLLFLLHFSFFFSETLQKHHKPKKHLKAITDYKLQPLLSRVYGLAMSWLQESFRWMIPSPFTGLHILFQRWNSGCYSFNLGTSWLCMLMLHEGNLGFPLILSL